MPTYLKASLLFWLNLVCAISVPSLYLSLRLSVSVSVGVWCLPACDCVPGACTWVGACEAEVVMEIFQWLLHFRVLREGLLLNLELLSSDWSVSPCPPISVPQLWSLAFHGFWGSSLKSLFVQRALYPLTHYPACDFFFNKWVVGFIHLNQIAKSDSKSQWACDL